MGESNGWSQAANSAVDRIIREVGLDAEGRPNSNVFAVSDHEFMPFHTAVSVANLVATTPLSALMD